MSNSKYSLTDVENELLRWCSLQDLMEWSPEHFFLYRLITLFINDEFYVIRFLSDLLLMNTIFVNYGSFPRLHEELEVLREE